MFVDEAEIIVEGGHGGPGKVSFYPGMTSGPDGGNGGRGGDVYIEATSDLTALKRFTTVKTIAAERGEGGQSNRKFGRDGKEITIVLPVGSLIVDTLTNETFELNTPGECLLIAEGGLGGRGNYEFKSSTNTTPERAQPGLDGQKRHLKVVLRLIAEFGLIGLPNAGKSSLLNELTQANPKIADYPFTTLEPNLGVWNSLIIADIPGLIEGASSGKGLGIKFLKHIEKVKILLHCIAADTEDPVKDYQVVRNELAEYSPDLLTKKELVLITKADLVSEADLKKLTKKISKLNPDVFVVSIHDWDKLQEFQKLLTTLG